MDITINSQDSIRVLTKILTFCAKLSDAIQLTPQPPNLCIRVLNSSQSAYTNFTLFPSFFTTLRLTSRTPQKVPIRALQPIFRTPATINTVHVTAPPLTITVNTKTVTKTFTPPLLDGRVPAIANSSHPSLITTSPSFFHTLLQNFHTRLDEITLIPSEDSLRLVSFVDDAGPASVMLRTEMTVSARELEQHVCRHEQPVELTLFCRPFRAAVDFCEAFDENILLAYDDPGVPVSLEMCIPGESGDTAAQARFVFASRLADDGVAVKKRSRLSTQMREESQRGSLSRGLGSVDRGSLGRESSARASFGRESLARSHATQRTEVESSGIVEATQDIAGSVAETQYKSSYERGGMDDGLAGRTDGFVEGTGGFVGGTDGYAGRNDGLGKRHDGYVGFGGDDGDVDDDDDDDDFVEGTPPPEG